MNADGKIRKTEFFTISFGYLFFFQRKGKINASIQTKPEAKRYGVRDERSQHAPGYCQSKRTP
jgi:hypothetical protein